MGSEGLIAALVPAELTNERLLGGNFAHVPRALLPEVGCVPACSA